MIAESFMLLQNDDYTFLNIIKVIGAHAFVQEFFWKSWRRGGTTFGVTAHILEVILHISIFLGVEILKMKSV